MLKCWDPDRTTSKLRNDAIKKRINNRYAEDVDKEAEATALPETIVVRKSQPRVEVKQLEREEKKAAKEAENAQKAIEKEQKRLHAMDAKRSSLVQKLNGINDRLNAATAPRM